MSDSIGAGQLGLVYLMVLSQGALYNIEQSSYSRPQSNSMQEWSGRVGCYRSIALEH